MGAQAATSPYAVSGHAMSAASPEWHGTQLLVRIGATSAYWRGVEQAVGAVSWHEVRIAFSIVAGSLPAVELPHAMRTPHPTQLVATTARPARWRYSSMTRIRVARRDARPGYLFRPEFRIARALRGRALPPGRARRSRGAEAR